MSNTSSLLDTVRKRVMGSNRPSGDDEPNSLSNDDQDQATIVTVPEMGRQYWMPDSISKNCYDCGLQFTTIRRRHHCRICGQIFCSNCCSMVDSRLLQLAAAGSKVELSPKDSASPSPSKSLRVCRYCHKSIVSSQLGQQQQQQKHGRPVSGDYQQQQQTRAEDKKRKMTLTSGELPSLSITPVSGNSTMDSNANAPVSTPSSMSRWFFNSLSSSFGVGGSGGSNSSKQSSSSLSTSYKESNNLQPPTSSERQHQKTIRSKTIDHSSSSFDSQKIAEQQRRTSEQASTVLYDLCTKMREMETELDANEPKWVREIFDQQTDASKGFKSGNNGESPLENEFKSVTGASGEEQVQDNDSSSSDDQRKDTRRSSSSSDNEDDTTEDEMEDARKESDGRSIDESGYHLNYKLGEPVVHYSTISRQPSRKRRPKLLGDNIISTSAANSPSESLVDSIQSDSLVLSQSLEPPLSPFSQHSPGSATPSRFYQRMSSTFSNSIDSKDSELLSSGSGAFTSSTLVAVDRYTLFYRLLEAIYDRQALAVVRQVLTDHRLSFDWLPILNDIAKRISRMVTLEQHAYLANIDNFYQLYQIDAEQQQQQQSQQQQGPQQQQAKDFLLNIIDSVSTIGGDNKQRNADKYYPMDIRQRVKIKAIPNGRQSDCSIVNGLVFTKNVAHRKMRTNIEQPRILLFACSIGYDERRRQLTTSTSSSTILKLTSFDSMIMQEASYISNLVAKVAAFKPDVIFVEGSVSRTTLELLHDYKITVVINVKRSVLEKIALFTNTYLVRSPEMLLPSSRLGQCGRFRLEEFVISPENDDRSASVITKTLMFLEGCPESIGCTVLLRGSTRYAVFRQLKQVLNFLIYVYYNARAEQAYHLASGVLPLVEQELRTSCSSLEELAKKILGGNIRTRINSSRSIKSMVSIPNENEQATMSALPTLETKMTTIEDNSDPLRASIMSENAENNNKTTSSTNGSSMTAESSAIIAEKFDNLLDRLPLSCSPGVRFKLPFLMEPKIYERSSMRGYFPANLLVSKRLRKEVKASFGQQHLLMQQDVDDDENDSGEETLVERSDNKDDNYANFSYLVNFEREKKEKEATAVNEDKYGQQQTSSGESMKLWHLRSHLAMRSMVIKQHPMLMNCDYDFRRQSRTFLADYRANGPQQRYIPDVFPRKKGKLPASQQSATKMSEALSVEWQQSLSVLFSLFPCSFVQGAMTVASPYCFPPRLLDIVYYGANDMSLGAFLFRHFFFVRSRFNQTISRGGNDIKSGNDHASTQGGAETGGRSNSPDFDPLGSKPASRKIWCANEKCEYSMFRHMMRFTHHRGTVTVKLAKMSRNDVTGNGNAATMAALARLNKVLTWSCCRECHKRSSFEEMTSDALALSFGKFLELKFYGDGHYHQQWYYESNPPCLHAWHRSACQFFLFDQLVVIFQYEPIQVNEVSLPAPIIPVTRNHFSKIELINLSQQMTLKISELYTRIDEELLAIRSVAVSKVNQQQLPAQASQVISKLEACYFDAQDIRLIDELLCISKAELEDLRQGIKSIHLFLTSPDLATTGVVELFRLRNMITFFIKSLVTAASNWTTKFNDYATFKRRNANNQMLAPFAETNLGLPGGKINLAKSEDTLDTISTTDDYDDVETSQDEQTDPGEDVTDQKALMGNLKTKLSSIISQVVTRVMPNTKPGANLMLSEGGSISEVNNSGAAGLTTSTAVFAAFFNAGAGPSKLLGNEEVQYIALEVNFNDLNPVLSTISTATGGAANSNAPANGNAANDNSPPGIKMFEHFNLPMFRDIAIVVKDRDLGSMIAYALTTPTYEKRLAELGSSKSTRNMNPNEASSSTQSTSNKDSPAKVASDGANENKPSQTNEHICLEFKDVYGKFYCQVYFAESFRRFRSLVLTDGGGSNREAIRNSMSTDTSSKNPSSSGIGSNSTLAEELYIFSLASSSPWNALGGKSGSTFSKTANGRFILKEVSKGELKHFLSFLPEYLAYCELAMVGRHPSALVKVVGVYQMTYKNTVTNKTGVHYILVMENLFYECNVTCVYDLKGSVRNRKVEMPAPKLPSRSGSAEKNLEDQGKETTVTPDKVVLLDGNLRQISTACPLYVHQHSKLLLIEALYRDSEFLRQHGVMDYSLLVGHDEAHTEYVVGIIDYVRLFNWEKVLESKVKKIGSTLDPTIVHPMNYQRRFIEAIFDYFTDVPDKWCNCLRLVGGNVGQIRLDGVTDDMGQDDESGFVVI